MSREITGKTPDPQEVYGDIIDHPHWVSPKHPPMSLYNRAAQFAPFAALSGYSEMIGEEARLVDNRIEPDEEGLAELNRKLNRLAEAAAAGEKPAVTVTFFVPDPLKSGGVYETVTAGVRRVDPVARTLILDSMDLSFADILDIWL